MALNWPKPYTKNLTRNQIRLIIRIYMIDKAERRKIGFERCTRGLRVRLAAEFGVKRKQIDEIIESISVTRSIKRRTYRDINIEVERENARRRRHARTRYRSAIAGDGTEQDPTGS